LTSIVRCFGLIFVLKANNEGRVPGKGEGKKGARFLLGPAHVRVGAAQRRLYAFWGGDPPEKKEGKCILTVSLDLRFGERKIKELSPSR